MSLKKTFKNNFFSSFYLGSFIFNLSFKKYLYFKKLIFWDFLNNLEIKQFFLCSKILKDFIYYNTGIYYLYTNNSYFLNSKNTFDAIEDFFFDSPHKTIKLVDTFEMGFFLEHKNEFFINWYLVLYIYIELYKSNIKFFVK